MSEQNEPTEKVLREMRKRAPKDVRVNTLTKSTGLRVHEIQAVVRAHPEMWRPQHGLVRYRSAEQKAREAEEHKVRAAARRAARDANTAHVLTLLKRRGVSFEQPEDDPHYFVVVQDPDYSCVVSCGAEYVRVGYIEVYHPLESLTPYTLRACLDAILTRELARDRFIASENKICDLRASFASKN